MTMETRTSGTEPAAVPHQVLSAASHELRGPLGVARGYLRLLQSASLDPRAAKMVTDAIRATDRMGELLDEVTEFARWARGEHALTMTSVALRDIVVAATTSAATPTHAQVRVEVDAPPDVTADADGAQLTRACASLLAAIARSQTRDATIVVAVRSGNLGRGVLLMAPGELLDSPAAERPAALERAGAGLSIALADLIVKRHGGALVERWVGEVWAGYEVRL
jgi:signal transduction histidine kinase